MIVNLQEGNYFCFGCNSSGNALNFVEGLNPNLNTLQATMKYFRILKSKKVQHIHYTRFKQIKKQTQESYDISHDYYYGLSKINWRNDKSIEVQEAKQYMKKRGYNEKALNDCGAKITYNNSYPIIFPMLDNGEFKGWVCRTTNKEVERKRKYLYNEGFSRATTLVGDYGKADYIFIVEGYMDRLRFIQNGYKQNVVAILGWKMSHEQEMKIKNNKNIKYIVSALDNDECGKKGTKYLRSIFPNVIRFKHIKGIKDVGEMSDEQFIKAYNFTMKKLAQIKRSQYS
jgi:DNA primase